MNPPPLSLTYRLRLSPMAKERPRVTRNGTFMPKAYNAWRDLVRAYCRQQTPTTALARLPLTSRVEFSMVICVPKGDMKPDGDNAMGAIWDAIQATKGKWGIIADDRLIKKWAGAVVTGPTAIHFTITEMGA